MTDEMPEWLRLVHQEERRQVFQRAASANRRAGYIAQGVDALGGQAPVATALGVSVAAVSKALSAAQARTREIDGRGADVIVIDIPNAGLQVPTEAEWSQSLSAGERQATARRALAVWRTILDTLRAQTLWHRERVRAIGDYLSYGDIDHLPEEAFEPDGAATRLRELIGYLPRRQDAVTMLCVHEEMAQSVHDQAQAASRNHALWEYRTASGDPRPVAQ